MRSKTAYSPVDLSSAVEGETSAAMEMRSLGPDNNEGKDETQTRHLRTAPRGTLSWSGPAALLSIVLLTAAAVGILFASNNSPIERWKIDNVNIQPQVWLSVLTTIMDGLTAFALADVATIVYWRAAARGTNLRSMFDLYESYSVLGAAKNIARLRSNKLAVATVLCLVSALRGPLFQRATIVASDFRQEVSGTQNLRVAQLIPPGLIYQNATSAPAWDTILDSYLEQSDINVDVDKAQCGDVCTGKVKGYGYDIKCLEPLKVPWDSSENSTIMRIYHDPLSDNQGGVPAFNASAHLHGVPDSYDAGSDASLDADRKGWFDIVNLYKTEPRCGGNVTVVNCSLHAAVVEYEVKIRNRTMSLVHDHWQNDKVLFQTPTWQMPRQDFEWTPTTHWASWVSEQFNQEITIRPPSVEYPAGRLGGAGGSSGPRLRLIKRFLNEQQTDNGIWLNCTSTWSNPTQYMLDRIRDMVFRTSVAAANITDMTMLFGQSDLIEDGLPNTQNWTQAVALSGERSVVAFKISLPYLVCAIIASLLSVVALAVLYWDVRGGSLLAETFNPIDVARIFGAPLLRDVDGEVTTEEFVRQSSVTVRLRCRREGHGGIGGAKIEADTP